MMIMRHWHPRTSSPAGSWRPSLTAPSPSGQKIWLGPFDNTKGWLTGALWRHWQREYLLQLRAYHEVRRPARHGPRFKVGDIVPLQEERTPRHMWKKARIDELLQWRDGRIRTVSLLLPDRTKISRPVQLVIPLEIDQGGEDMEDWNIFLLNHWWVIRDFDILWSKCIYSL